MPLDEAVLPQADVLESRRGPGGRCCKQQKVEVGHHRLADVVEAVVGAEVPVGRQHDGDQGSRMLLWSGQPGIQAVNVLGGKQVHIVRGEADCTMEQGDHTAVLKRGEILAAEVEGVILRKGACLAHMEVFATPLAREDRQSAHTAVVQVRRVSECQMAHIRQGAQYSSPDRCQTWFSHGARALEARNPVPEFVPVPASLARDRVLVPFPGPPFRIFRAQTRNAVPHT